MLFPDLFVFLMIPSLDKRTISKVGRGLGSAGPYGQQPKNGPKSNKMFVLDFKAKRLRVVCIINYQIFNSPPWVLSQLLQFYLQVHQSIEASEFKFN